MARLGPAHFLPRWLAAAAGSGMLHDLLQHPAEEGAYFQDHQRRARQRLFLSTLDLGEEYRYWTVGQLPPLTEEMQVLFHTQSSSGIVRPAESAHDFWNSPEPVWWQEEPDRRLLLRGLEYVQETVSSSGTVFTLSLAPSGLVGDGDVFWKKSGDLHWRRVRAHTGALNGVTVSVPASGTHLFAYPSQRVRSQLASGQARLLFPTGQSPLLDLVPQDYANILDAWGEVLGVPRLPEESNLTYRNRLLNETQDPPDSTLNGVIRGIAGRIGKTTFHTWNGVDTLTLDTSGVSGITTLKVVGVDQVQRVSEQLLPHPVTQNVFYASYPDWRPQWALYVDGLPEPYAQLSGNVVLLAQPTTGHVTAEYGIDRYTFTHNASGYLSSVLPGTGLPSGAYTVVASHWVKAGVVELPDFQQERLLTPDGVPNGLFREIAGQVQADNPTVFGRARWGLDAAWFRQTETEIPGITYLHHPFDYQTTVRPYRIIPTFLGSGTPLFGAVTGTGVADWTPLLNTAVAYWRASDYQWGGTLIDGTGNGHTAYLGSSKTPAIDYDYSGTVCLKLFGSTGHYASALDSAALSITGDIDLQVKVALDDWTPAADTTLVSKSTAGNFSYLLRMRGSGKPTLLIGSAGGGILNNLDATAAVSFTDGDPGWVRATFTVATGVIRFYTSTDGTNWTQLGTDVAGTSGAIGDSTQPVEIGSYNGGTNDLATGKFYRVRIYNGIGGTLAFDANFEAADPGDVALVESSANAAVVTIGRRAVATDGFFWIPGVTGNYASLADSAALSVTGDIDIRVKAALHNWSTGSFQALLGKWSAGSPRSYILYVNTTGGLRFNVNITGPAAISVDSSASLSLVNGATKWVRVTRSATNGDIKFYTSDDGTTWTQLGTTQSASAGALVDTLDELQIGAGNSTDFATGKYYRAVIYSDLTETTKVLDVDFTTQEHNTPGFYESSSNAAWVTLNATALPSSDSNDPLFLPYSATDGKYLYLPGSSGNYGSVPDSAAFAFTDLRLQAKVALTDWTPATNVALLAKDQGANRDFVFAVTTPLGTLALTWWESGGTLRTVTSSVAPMVTDGAPLWLRADLDVDNGAGGHTVTFYTSTDGSTWTQLGTTQNAGAFTTSVRRTASILTIGENSGVPSLVGNVYRAQVYGDTAGSDTRLDVDFSNANEPYATFTESSSNAATVTINRGSSGRKATLVDRDLFLLATDDSLQILDHADLDIGATDNLTACIVFRRFGDQTGILFGKTNTGSGPGWWMAFESPSYQLGARFHDGTNVAQPQVSSAYTPGITTQASLVRNVTADTVAVYNDTTSIVSVTDPTTTTTANSEPLRIGAVGLGAYGDFEFVGMAVFRGVLTTTQLAAVKTELLA